MTAPTSVRLTQHQRARVHATGRTLAEIIDHGLAAIEHQHQDHDPASHAQRCSALADLRAELDDLRAVEHRVADHDAELAALRARVEQLADNHRAAPTTSTSTSSAEIAGRTSLDQLRDAFTGPFTAAQAARCWRTSPRSARARLAKLADRREIEHVPPDPPPPTGHRTGRAPGRYRLTRNSDRGPLSPPDN